MADQVFIDKVVSAFWEPSSNPLHREALVAFFGDYLVQNISDHWDTTGLVVPDVPDFDSTHVDFLDGYCSDARLVELENGDDFFPDELFVLKKAWLEAAFSGEQCGLPAYVISEISDCRRRLCYAVTFVTGGAPQAVQYDYRGLFRTMKDAWTEVRGMGIVDIDHGY